MSNETLTVKLKGPNAAKGAVSAEDFCDFLTNVLVCLRRVESKFEGIPKLTYQIVGLKQESAIAELKPVHKHSDTPNGGKVLRLFEEVTESIQAGRPVDNRFSSSDLLPFKRLAMPLKNGVKEIRISDTTVSSDYLVNLEKMLGEARVSFGSVRGKIEKLNMHDRHECTVFPLIGHRVQCTFGEPLYGDVLKAMRQNATIYGKVSYLPGHDFPDKIKATEIVVHKPDSELPKFSDMRGRSKGRLRGKTSAEYVRAMRGQ